MNPIRRIALVCLLLITGSWFHVASAVELEGDIVVDTVWSKSLSPYVITGDVIIAENATLTIGPGVVVEFEKTGSSDGFHLEVNGTLRAIGTEDDPILFTIQDKEYHWGHIEFTETSTPWNPDNQTGSTLQYCIVEYAGNGRVESSERAAIRVESASPLIHRSIVRNSKNDGIRIVSGRAVVSDNRIHGTTCGIKVIDPQSSVVRNNYLLENRQGIYVESGSESVQVENNTVLSASSEGYGAALGGRLSYHDTLSSFSWKQVAGPLVSLSDPGEAMPGFTVPEVAQDEFLEFQLTVTDRDGLQAVDTVRVNVNWENAAPTANAGADRVVEPGARVTLDATGSFDNDDGIAAYEWIQTSGADVTSTWTKDSSAKLCSFAAPEPVGGFGEDLIFELTVTDQSGLVDRDTVRVHVNSSTPSQAYPKADAGLTIAATEGDTVTLDGNGSTPQERIVSYLWEQVFADGEDPIADNYVELVYPETGPGRQVTFSAPPVGLAGRSLKFKLTVTDSRNNVSTDEVVVNVLDTDTVNRNDPPTAEAGVDQVVDETPSSQVTLNGSYSDPDDNLPTYRWESLSGTVTLVGTGASRTFQVPDVKKDETFVFRLTVTDSGGLQHTDTTTVSVNWVNEKPNAKAEADTEVEEGLTVQLDGSGSSDPDGNIETYAWRRCDDNPVAIEIFNADAPKALFRAPDVTQDTVFVFCLTVTDGGDDPGNVDGGEMSDWDDVVVTVKPASSAPTAAADAPAKVVGFGDEVLLDGTGSSDPEDDIVSFLWEQIGESYPVTLADATTASPRFTAPASGGEKAFLTLTFQLTVTDAEGNDDIDTVLINVRDTSQASEAPVADAGPDQQAGALAAATLNGTGSYDPDTHPELTIVKNSFRYEIIEGLSENDGPPGNLVSLASGENANGRLTFESNNLLNRDGNYSFHLFSWRGESVTTIALTGNWWETASDSEIDGLIYDQTDESGDSTLPRVTHAAAAVENAGCGSDLSYPPIGDAGEDRAEDPDTLVTLTCTGVYDPDNVLTYVWEQTQGTPVTLRDADRCESTFVVPKPADEESGDPDQDNELTFRLTVTDAYGFYDSDDVLITVNQAEDEEKKTHTTSGCFISILGTDR